MRETPETVSFESLNRLARRSLEEKSSCNSSWRMGEQPKKLLTWCQTNASALSSNIIDGGPRRGTSKPGRIGQKTVRKESMHGDGQHTSKNPIPKQLAEYFAREDTLQNETPRSARKDTTQKTRDGRCERKCQRMPEKHSVVQTQTNMDYRQPLREGRLG